MSDLASTSEKERQIEAAAWAILLVRFYNPEPEMYASLDAFYTDLRKSDHWPDALAEAEAVIAALASPAPAESREPVGYVTQAAIDLMIEAKPGSSGYHLIFSTPHAKSLPKQQSADVPIYAHPPAESAGSPSTSGVGVRSATSIYAPHDPLGSIAAYLASQPRDPSMWATVVENDYDGELRWDCHTEGDRGDGDSLTTIELAANTFPVGTKIEIREPADPSDPSRDTQPALLSTDETKEGGNG